MTSLLDAARKLAADQPLNDEALCVFCGAYADDPHTTDCPWKSLPQIVAVIEAAEAAVDEFGHTKRCPFCGPRLQLRPRARHDEVCPWTALAAALRGGDGEEEG